MPMLTADPLLAPGVALAWRATLLLAVGLGVLVALPHASAATRHWLLRLVLGATAILPFALWLTPRVPVAMPWPSRPYGTVAADPTGMARVLASSPGPLATGDGRLAAPHGTVSASDLPPTSGQRPDAGLMLLWALGSALVIVRVVVTTVEHRRRLRAARPLVDGRVQRRVDAVAACLGLRRRVAVRLGTAEAMPSTAGLTSPVVLLPVTALTWHDAQLDAVVAHELAHVARHDVAGRALAAAVCALFWWHPLAWLAARALARTAEHACDDLALACGQRPTSYAAALVAIAATPHRAQRLALALPMAAEGTLAGRIEAILATARMRRGPSLPLRRLGAAAAVAGTLAVASVVPVPVQANPADPAPARQGRGPSVAPRTTTTRTDASGAASSPTRARTAVAPTRTASLLSAATRAQPDTLEGDVVVASPDSLMLLVVRDREIALRYTAKGRRWADSIADAAAARAGSATAFRMPNVPTAALMTVPLDVVGRAWQADGVIALETRDRVARTPHAASVSADSARILLARVRAGGQRGVFMFEAADAASARRVVDAVTRRLGP